MFLPFSGSHLFFGPELSDVCLIAFVFSPGPPEMLLILVIALLLYGGKLPEMARTWGKTLAEFRRSLSGIQNELNDVMYSAKDHLAIDQKDWRGEEELYSDDSAEETSGYDEESQEDSSTDDVSTTINPSIDEPSTDSDVAEEFSPEKQSSPESD